MIRASYISNHEPQAFRTRKKAGDTPHSKRWREIRSPLAEKSAGGRRKWR
jgi:hypothetical protein